MAKSVKVAPGVVEIWQTLRRTSLVCGCLGFSQPDINGPHKRTPPLLSKWWQSSGRGGPGLLKEGQSQGQPANQPLKILPENRILQRKGMCSYHHPQAFYKHMLLCVALTPQVPTHVFLFCTYLSSESHAILLEFLFQDHLNLPGELQKENRKFPHALHPASPNVHVLQNHRKPQKNSQN